MTFGMTLGMTRDMAGRTAPLTPYSRVSIAFARKTAQDSAR